MTTTITAKIFEDYLDCETKAYLRSIGETGRGNTFADWVQAQDALYRSESVKKLIQKIPPQECFDCSSEPQNLKKFKWRLALNFVAKSSNLESRIQALHRIPSTERLHPAEYIPVRFIFRNTLTRNDKLLLAFDGIVISQLLGRAVRIGKIIHGDDDTPLKVKITPLVSEVQKLLKKISMMISGNLRPELILNRHCAECEFQIHCRQIAFEKDDLSLLSGISRKEQKKLNKKGIFTITQLSYTFRPRRRPRRISNKSLKYYHSLKALSIREGKIYVVGDEKFNIEGIPVYLDVEGFPDRKLYYLIGMRVEMGQQSLQHSFWANVFEDEKEIWRNFIEILEAIQNPVLIHYGKFEVAFLKQMSHRYGGLAPDSPAGNAIKSCINLLSFIYARIYFPAYGNGLKGLAKCLGFQWSEPNASGIQSIPWRWEWENSKEDSWKDRLIAYNAEDCKALNLITDFVRGLSANNQANIYQGKDIVRTDSLPLESPFKFKKNKFHLSVMEEINRAAYWDYQREILPLKTNQRVTKIKKTATGRTRDIPRINKVIHWPPPKTCPRCGSGRFVRHQKHSRIIVDLRFGSSALKRWITKNIFYRYKCSSCSSVFRNPELNFGHTKFGTNLRSMTVYMNIDIGVPQERVALFLNQVLGFQLSRAATNKFKAEAATSYRNAYEMLLQKILKGRLIHIDETRVNVKGIVGYIWVITSLEEVVYIYAPTREGELVQSLLKHFNGVLISDFYAAYDSISCPQQKCLIHLIRDLNDDLIKEPFNQEIKALISDFSCLVKGIIETIDRFGLKKRFLHKHKIYVDRFFRKLLRQEYETDIARKCKKRFEKNRNTLFTFLDYDGAPWNNNNAEHAIKAVAKLRRDFSGVTTEKGIRDYMVLLSICATCRFKGVSFLDFLLSRETDVDAFVERTLKRGRNRSLNF